MSPESDSKTCFETRLRSSSSSCSLRSTTKHSSLMVILLNIITIISFSSSSSLFVSCDDSPSFSLSPLDPLESNNNNNNHGKINHYHRRIRSQSFREETSIVSLSSANQMFDMKQELIDSISSIILGNNNQRQPINFLIQSSRQVIEEKRHKTSSSRSNLFQDHEDSFDVREKDITRSSSSSSSSSSLSSVPQNITGFVGHPVFLHCFVDSLGSLSSDKTVSWIRLKDFSLLTVGLFTYTSDERFVVRLNDQGNDWCLSIKHVSLQDQGLYECQVNSDPPRSSFYRLIVKESETRMIGGPDMFVRTGQPLILNCILKNPPSTLTSFIVFWYKEDKMINYDLSESSRGFTQVINKREEEEVVARLTIKSARLNDSGNYSCHFVGSSSGSSSSGDEDEDGRNGGRKSHNNNNIYVHVLQGKSLIVYVHILMMMVMVMVMIY